MCIFYLVSFIHVLSDILIIYYETDITRITLNLCADVKMRTGCIWHRRESSRGYC